jgi:hypothetical protein
LCNGASLNTTTFATLFAAIAYTYGGAGANFNIPDAQGTFLRGAGTSSGYTQNVTIALGGTKVNDAMQGHSKSLESLLHCVSMRWPALLVGPCGSGKRRCVEYLAMQTGHVVEHYSASTATDSTDLLGSFEQVSAYRHLALAIGE